MLPFSTVQFVCEYSILSTLMQNKSGLFLEAKLYKLFPFLRSKVVKLLSLQKRDTKFTFCETSNCIKSLLRQLRVFKLTF